MIDSTSVVGSAQLAQATRAADARTGVTAAVNAVQTSITPDEQVASTVIQPESEKSQPQFYYNAEGNISYPPTDKSSSSVSYKA